MTIYISDPISSVLSYYPIDIDADTTGDDLKNEISDRLELPKDRFELTLLSKVVDPALTLADMSICPDVHLRIKYTPRDDICLVYNGDYPDQICSVNLYQRYHGNLFAETMSLIVENNGTMGDLYISTINSSSLHIDLKRDDIEIDQYGIFNINDLEFFPRTDIIEPDFKKLILPKGLREHFDYGNDYLKDKEVEWFDHWIKVGAMIPK